MAKYNFSPCSKRFFLILGAFGFATMWEAVFADVGVTVIAVINSMRVLKNNLVMNDKVTLQKWSSFL